MLFHATSEARVLEHLRTSEAGLTATEAETRRKTYGKNLLPKKPSLRVWTILFGQLKSPLMGILALAGLASAWVQDITDALFILAAMAVNVSVGFLQEYKANHALEELQSFLVPRCRVRREGVALEIDASDLVPGDVALLLLGDRVPADLRLLRAEHAETDEAPLTGESAPVAKRTEALSLETALPDRTNMLYAGTLLVAGRAEGVVTATGKETEIGRIAEMVREVREPETPLQTELRTLGRFLAGLFVLLALGIFFAGLFGGVQISEMFFLAVALAVAAIPEGLLVAVTVILAVGMQRMLKRKALVRRLLATETLGSVSVICADKTGTVTEASMRASALMTVDGVVESSVISQAGMTNMMRKMVEIGMVCNDATSPQLGSPTETALLALGENLGYKQNDIHRRHVRLDEIPFDSARKYMAVLVESEGGTREVYVKGAVEQIVSLCTRVLLPTGVAPFDAVRRERFMTGAEERTGRGLRVLGFAYLPAETLSVADGIFVGWVALHDPVRPTAKDTLRRARSAGIRPVMITGDHPNTARAIAEEVGLSADPRVLAGTELDCLSEQELEERIDAIDVFARVLPEHKVRIVRAWQAKGGVVAMTGDGVNDAPALAAADVGVALGTGSHVAKEAADVVLLDNNLETIVAAVEEGRVMFANIRKIVSFLLLTSWTEMIMVVLALVTKLPTPLLAAPILYINLITDSAPALALTVDSAESRVMQEPPRTRRTPIVDPPTRRLVVGLGLGLSLVPFVVYAMLLAGGEDVAQARSVIFALVSLQTLALAFPLRRARTAFWQDGFFTNRFLNGSFILGLALTALAFSPLLAPIFAFRPLQTIEYVLIAAVILLEFFFVEVYKWAMKYGASYRHYSRV